MKQVLESQELERCVTLFFKIGFKLINNLNIQTIFFLHFEVPRTKTNNKPMSRTMRFPTSIRIKTKEK